MVWRNIRVVLLINEGFISARCSAETVAGEMEWIVLTRTSIGRLLVSTDILERDYAVSVLAKTTKS